MTEPLPLEGLRILDLATMLAGPMAATLLADFGAEVVKVELPVRGDPARDLPPHKDGVPLWWKVLNRNKSCITLDIRKPEGRTLMLEAIRGFDVLVENFRPGTLERYGLAPEVLQEVNPQLTILRVSGYGQTGPMACQPGFARVAEAFSGFTFLCGEAESAPLHLGFPVADANAGVFGAFSVLTALMGQRNAPEAKGKVIDLSLTEALFRMLEFLPIEYDQLGAVRHRSGNRSQYASPSNIFQTCDNSWISMSASAQGVFERLARLMDREDLIDDPRFINNAARVKNTEALNDIVGDWFLGQSRDQALAALRGAQVSGGPVHSIADIFEDPQFTFRAAIEKVADDQLGPIAMPAVVPRMGPDPYPIRHSGRKLGEDTRDFFRAMGLDDERIKALRRDEVV